MRALAAQSAPVTQWPERVALTVVVLAVCVWAVWAMRRSWLRRARQDADLVLPAAPGDPGPVTVQVEGQYYGTSPADQWMRRVTAAGLGAPGRAVVQVAAAGILMQRTGESDIFLPREWIADAELGRGVAAEVAEKDGLVLWRWRTGRFDLVSGFRPDHPHDVVALLQASRALLSGVAGKENA